MSPEINTMKVPKLWTMQIYTVSREEERRILQEERLDLVVVVVPHLQLLIC